MRSIMIILMAAGLVALVNSLPFVQNEDFQSPTLDQLTMVDDSNEPSHRTKRTIGILRQFFPEISQIIEKKVNMIVAEVIRALGPTLIQGLLRGGGRGGNTGGKTDDDDGGDDGSTVTVALPDDEDDDDDDDDDLNDNHDKNNNNNNNSSDNITSDGGVSVSLPAISPDDENESSATASTTTISTISNVNQVRYQSQEDMNGEASENNEVRVSFDDIQPAANEAVESELSPLGDIEVSDEESRNKRLVSLEGNSGGGGGGSGGGSGNFLFDIIRLVAGSGSQSSDGGPSIEKSPEIEEAVPGPATRLLVIANRGISNLIQDLILRIAATSERFVNFKARLITSII